MLPTKGPAECSRLRPHPRSAKGLVWKRRAVSLDADVGPLTATDAFDDRDRVDLWLPKVAVVAPWRGEAERDHTI